jgi:multimeric flavodoxin WrbA
MKIAVLNGSPKGMTSVTMQYVLFLRKKFPQHDWVILDVCHDIRRLEEHPEAFGEVIATIAAADGVLWAFPLYVFLVHAHYKRFIELVFERGAQGAFAGKHAAVLTTSIHFFDHTAHNYVAAVSDDLDMNYVGGFSAEMYDLQKEAERKRLLLFAEGLLEAIERGTPMPRRHAPLRPGDLVYAPGPPPSRSGEFHQRILVLTDAGPGDANLGRMIDRFRQCFAQPIEVINLREVSIRGGCQGCIRCSLDNVCVFRDADDVYRVYQRLIAADVLVFAGAVKDRYLSSRWKLFWDRGFFNNHVPMFGGKQIGWLVSGPLGQIANLRQMLEVYVEMQPANLFGLVTDECGDSGQLDRLIDGFARALVRGAQSGYIQPPSFFTVAGGKLFRDEIWSRLRFVFQADHRYFKRHGLYKFPRRSFKTRLTDALFTLLLKIPSFRRQFQLQIKDKMIEPLAKVIDEA